MYELSVCCTLYRLTNVAFIEHFHRKKNNTHGIAMTQQQVGGATAALYEDYFYVAATVQYRGFVDIKSTLFDG